MKKYTAYLMNSQCLVFDNAESNSLATLKEWARGRGTREYRLFITATKTCEVTTYKVLGGKRVCHVDTNPGGVQAGCFI